MCEELGNTVVKFLFIIRNFIFKKYAYSSIYLNFINLGHFNSSVGRTNKYKYVRINIFSSINLNITQSSPVSLKSKHHHE